MEDRIREYMVLMNLSLTTYEVSSDELRKMPEDEFEKFIQEKAELEHSILEMEKGLCRDYAGKTALVNNTVVLYIGDISIALRKVDSFVSIDLW